MGLGQVPGMFYALLVGLLCQAGLAFPVTGAPLRMIVPSGLARKTSLPMLPRIRSINNFCFIVFFYGRMKKSTY